MNIVEEVSRNLARYSSRRQFFKFMTASSLGRTRFTPSPIEVSMRRMSRTRRLIPFGSSDAAWSEPQSERSVVM